MNLATLRLYRITRARDCRQSVGSGNALDPGGTHCPDRARRKHAALRRRAAGNHAVEDLLLSERPGRHQLERRVSLRLYGGRGRPPSTPSTHPLRPPPPPPPPPTPPPPTPP